MMGKVKRLYHQKYRPEWERFPAFGNWLCKSENGYSAHCKLCDVNILTRLASIKQHHNTRKHQEALRCNNFVAQPIIKNDYKMERRESVDSCKRGYKKSFDMYSNDSMLEDLVGNEDADKVIRLKYESEEARSEELQDDVISGKHIITEFDLFGKSVSLQLNNMELEDALLCQDKLQSVMTEFRIMILKREREIAQSI